MSKVDDPALCSLVLVVFAFVLFLAVIMVYTELIPALKEGKNKTALVINLEDKLDET